MRIENPFQMNDWPIRKFFIIIFTFQLLLWGSIGLDSIGFRIPILRQFICFIYLTFVPGILILRVLKLHKLESIKSLLYSIGLSLSFLMLVGFFMNTFYPLIGINEPISIIPLTVTVSFIVLLLCNLCYLIDRNFSDPNYLNLNNIFSFPSLFLYLIPMLTVIGTYLVNFYNNNFLLMIVIFFISLIVIFVSFDRIPPSLYPLAVFITSFSLLFHNSLISMYIYGWDIQYEYNLANKVITDGLWNMSNFSTINAMLSIVIIAPIYSILSDLDLTWVFKLIYPAIFSLMPLGLYLIFKRQTTNKIAFMAVFFFMSFFPFYTEMLQLARQQIAEYFFMLILLLIIQNRQDISNHTLLILFSFSVVVSHYGLSYIVLASIICSLVLLFLYHKYLDNSSPINTINFTFTLLFTVFLVAWYMYISSSSALYIIVRIANNILENFISGFLNPDAAQGLYLLSNNNDTLLHELAKIMHIFTQLCISIGLYHVTTRKSIKYLKFNNEYLSLCAVFYLILVAAIAIPNFSSALNTTRLYQITLILLAPFCVIGGMILLRALSKRVPQLNIKENNALTQKILSMFFAIFLLFNSGWIYEIAGDTPASFSLNSNFDYPKFNDRDVAGKEWLYQVNRIEENNGYIYADDYRFLLFLSCFDRNNISMFPKSIDQISRNSYTYLSTYNILKNEILIHNETDENIPSKYVNFDLYISSKNQIYNNGGSKIYYQ